MDIHIRELALGLRFPEGPIAFADGSVLLVELQGATLARVFPRDRSSDDGGMRLPEFDPTVYGGGRIERVYLVTGAVQILYDRCNDNLLCATNDLVFDSSGGFWFTYTGKQRGRSADFGAICYALASGDSIREVMFPLASPNGIALSPDEATLHFAETFTGRVWHYPLAASGQLQIAHSPFDASRLLYRSPGLWTFDSMAIDARGYLFIACLMDAGISVISPQGELEVFLSLPDPITTHICFGGPLLRTAYVTLATHCKLISFDVADPGHPLPFDSRCPLNQQPRFEQRDP